MLGMAAWCLQNEDIHLGYSFPLCFIFPWTLFKTHIIPANFDSKFPLYTQNYSVTIHFDWKYTSYFTDQS